MKVIFDCLLAIFFIGSLFGVAYTQPENTILLIKVDQFGYRPNAQKIAVISSPQEGFNGGSEYIPPSDLHLVDYEERQVVWSGSTESWNSGQIHEQSGDQIWWFDFSEFVSPGHYFIIDSVNDVRSDVFTISDHIYNHVLKHAVRMFYYQRCGIAKENPYAENGWTDVACHIHEGQDVECLPRSGDGPVRDLSGGWHDAGDYNKYTTFTYSTVHQLLSAYEDNPDVFHDNYEIPESGNGIPDLVDEIKYELNFLQKMMLDDGQVLQKVSVTEHQGESPPSADHSARYYAPSASSATRCLASIFAHACLVLNQFDELKEYAGELLDNSELAWTWVKNNPGYSKYDNSGFSSANPERSEYDQDAYLFTAAVYLYLTTGEEEYKTFIESHYQNIHAMQWGYWYGYEYSYERALLDYADSPNADDDIRSAIYQSFIGSFQGEEFLQAVNGKRDAYLAYLKNADYGWGSNSLKARVGELFYDIFRVGINEEANYLNTAEEYIHYLHGRNAIGKMFLTNMNENGAQNSANEMYHLWFGDGTAFDNALTSPFGPPPGYLTGGVNKNYRPDDSYSGPRLAPPLDQPIQKWYKDWNTSWPENSWEITEPAIYYQAAYIMLLSKFASDEPVEVDLPEIISASEADMDHSKLTPFPVPASDYLTVPMVHPGFDRVEFVNMQGQTVRVSNSQISVLHSSVRVGISNLPDSSYTLRVIYKDNVEVYKVVVK